ncbi:DUF3124 domain-containing protein [Dokdonia genika]|uniref:DUF3124 domain-containing protein n=1 Tax=Dokdonia genika TaxID=308113 RepID=A0ABV9L8A7_9FLAO
MKYLYSLIFALLFLSSCEEPRKLSSTNADNWSKRTVKSALPESLEKGSTFLSIYSQIYMRSEKDEADLTATVSLHNPNLTERIFIDKAIYYNTHGEPIRTYFDKTIYINPMETVQIVIDGVDKAGGTGANFVFDWQINQNGNEPIIEAVMISTYGNQNISFVTTGKKIK